MPGAFDTIRVRTPFADLEIELHPVSVDAEARDTSVRELVRLVRDFARSTTGASMRTRILLAWMETREDAELSPFLAMCPVRGASMICGEAAVYVIYGRWPDAARGTGIGDRAGQIVNGLGEGAWFDDGAVVGTTVRPVSHETAAVGVWSVASQRGATPSAFIAVAASARVYVLGVASTRARDAVLFGWRDTAAAGAVASPTAYLARFDGRALREIPAPPSTEISSYVESGAGEAWAVTADVDQPWHRLSDGTWRKEPLPMPYVSMDVSTAGDDAIWVRAYGPIAGEGRNRETGNNVALFSTKRPSRVLELGR